MKNDVFGMRSNTLFIAHIISTQGMWAILGQSTPSSFEYLCCRCGHPHVHSCERVSGNSPSLGKIDRSFGQSSIHRCSREVRVWRDREVRDSRFWNPEMEREVRVVGRRIKRGSFEKEVASGNLPPMKRFLREVSPERPHWDRGILIFSQLQM